MSEKADKPIRKPATGGNRTAGKPAAGKKTYGKPVSAGKKATGKPPAGGKKAFGKPAAGAGRATGKPEAGEKKTYGKPAGKPGERRSFGRPVGSGKTVGRPGERKPSARPAAPKAPAKARPRPGEMEGLASRRAALKVIRAVTEEGAYASLALDRALRDSGLNGADRRLAARLTYDTLDRLIYLDHMLGQVMAREDTDIRLRNILRLGACQILIEDRIPESAATNTCVQLCTEIGLEPL